MLIGLDTSVVVGLLDSKDHWHPAATGLQGALIAAGLEPVYFDCVLAEAVSTLARRLREKRREGELPDLLDRLSTTFPEGTLSWILPDAPRLYRQVMDLIRSSEGELNFNDSLIALACRERQIEALASFDRDFDRISWLKRAAIPEDVNALFTRSGEPPAGQE
ncbi:MAG TPA: type II toxin-antitoxin system VapC family toxin [Candidatus Binatia bacterium]|nr:type II toxin-antitoxin system VapC family toxin [Candidatus Binatia bacterium]